MKETEKAEGPAARAAEEPEPAERAPRIEDAVSGGFHWNVRDFARY